VAEARQIAPESPDTAETLAAMRRALLRSGDRFALFIAVSNSPRRTCELIRLLEDAAPGLEIVDLTAPVEDPLAAIGDRVEADERGPLMVLGLEHSLSTDQVYAPVLRVLNMQRERWPDALRRPVVLWVPEFALELLGQAAPDFLDWRSDTFHFDDADPEGGGNKELRALDAAVWKGGLDEGLPLADRRRRIDELRSRLVSTEGAEDHRVRAARGGWVYELGLHLYRLGGWDEAEACFREALGIAEAVGDRRNQTAAYHQLGLIAEERGAYDEALDWHRKSLAISEELGHRAGMAYSHHQLGRIAEERGAYDEALDWYRKSLVISEALGDSVGIAASYLQLGMVGERRGAFDEALDWYRKSLAIFEGIGDRAGMAVVYHQLGMIGEIHADYDEALDWYRRSLAIKEELGDRAGMASSYHQLGTVAQVRGAYDEAMDWYRKTLAICEELGDRAGTASSLSQIGILWTEQAEMEKGLPLNLRSLALRLELGVPQVAIDLHWLRRQCDLLGEERFQAIVKREGAVDPDLLTRLLREPEPDEAPLPAPATA
jgi:tetratricopeptide (TPR) repeat protein